MSKSITSPDEQALSRFGWLMGGLLAGLFGVFFPWWLGGGFPLWPWVAGGLLALVGFLSPRWLAPLHKGWLALGEGVGWINSRVILAIVFYLLVLPIGLVMRLLGKDPMHRGFDTKANSYRSESTERAVNHFERPF